MFAGRRQFRDHGEFMGACRTDLRLSLNQVLAVLSEGLGEPVTKMHQAMDRSGARSVLEYKVRERLAAWGNVQCPGDPEPS